LKETLQNIKFATKFVAPKDCYYDQKSKYDSLYSNFIYLWYLVEETRRGRRVTRVVRVLL
jgi:hypothetical protein